MLFFFLFLFVSPHEGGRFGGGVGDGGALDAVCCSSIRLAVVHLLQPLYWAVQTLWRLVSDGI